MYQFKPIFIQHRLQRGQLRSRPLAIRLAYDYLSQGTQFFHQGFNTAVLYPRGQVFRINENCNVIRHSLYLFFYRIPFLNLQKEWGFRGGAPPWWPCALSTSPKRITLLWQQVAKYRIKALSAVRPRRRGSGRRREIPAFAGMTFGWSEGKAFPFLIKKQGRFPPWWPCALKAKL